MSSLPCGHLDCDHIPKCCLCVIHTNMAYQCYVLQRSEPFYRIADQFLRGGCCNSCEHEWVADQWPSSSSNVCNHEDEASRAKLSHGGYFAEIWRWILGSSRKLQGEIPQWFRAARMQTFPHLWILPPVMMQLSAWKPPLPPLCDMAYCAHVLLLAKQSFELGTER